MYLDRVRRRLQQLDDIGIEIGRVEPATPAQVDALEKKFGCRVPQVVRELYLWAGNDLGEYMNDTGGIDVAAHLKKDFRHDACEILSDADCDASVLDRPAIVIDMDYNGGFTFVYADEHADPAVYAHNETHLLIRFCERLSDYLWLLTEQCAGVEPIAVAGFEEEITADVKHLLFWGEVQFERIPEEVFQLPELQTLNLACKGLVEVSPRLSELRCVKRLDLARNSLTSLPAELTELRELEDLDVSENKLTSMIDIIEAAPSLRYCTIRGNPITAEEIARIKNKFPKLDLGLA